MKLTIIPDDGTVYKDSVSYNNLDLSFIPVNIHAFQWYGNYGEIEFKNEFVNGTFIHPQNEIITALPEWADQALSKWDEAEAARIAAEQSTLAALEQQP